MKDSPCYKCPENPCKHHDTCPDFQDFRREKREEKKMKDEERAAMDIVCLAIRRCKRKK